MTGTESQERSQSRTTDRSGSISESITELTKTRRSDIQALNCSSERRGGVACRSITKFSHVERSIHRHPCEQMSYLRKCTTPCIDNRFKHCLTWAIRVSPRT